MNFRDSLFLSSILLSMTVTPSEAQRLKKADKVIIDHLAQHVNYLSVQHVTDEAKAQLAMEYICTQFKRSGVEPKGDEGSYVHSFDIPLGWGISSGSFLSINGEEIKPDGYFPLLTSPHISLEASPSLGLQESGEPWFLDLKEKLENTGDSGVTVKSYLFAKATDAHKKGATVLFIYNTSEIADGLEFDGNEKCQPLPLPVVYVRKPAAKKYFSDETAGMEVKLKVEFVEKKRRSQYVIGFINNSSEKTIMIATNEIANNTAALIEVADLLKNSKSKNNNYLLVAFFDKEGFAPDGAAEVPASSFAMNPGKANYLINMNGAADTEKLNYIYTIVEKAK